MRGALLLIVIVGAIPAIFVKPHLGLLVYSWLSYMAPHQAVWGIASQLPLVFIVGAVTIVAWLLSREPKRLPMNGPTILLIAFAGWITLTTLFAISDLAFDKWQTTMKAMLITFITLPLISTKQRLDTLIWVIVISIGYFGVKGGMFVLATGGNYRVYGPESSFLEANNNIGVALLMVIPLMRYLQLQYKKRWLWWLLSFSMVMSFAAVLGTYSRGTLLAAVAMGVVFWMKSRQKLAIGLLIFVVVCGALVAAPAQWFDRAETIETYEEDASAQARLRTWTLMWRIAANNPLFGGGFMVHAEWSVYTKYKAELTRIRSPHSAYFEVLAEHGFLGILLYALLLGVVWRTGSWLIKQGKQREDLRWARELGAMTQVGIVGFAVGAAFVNTAYFEPFLHLVAIMAVTKAMVMRAILEKEPPEPVGAGADLSTRSAPS